MFLFNKIKLLLAIFLLSTSLPTFAKDVVIDPVHLESIAVINVDSLGQRAGNLEIKIEGGIQDLKGLNCDPNYVTTKNSGAGYSQMLSVLLTAHTANKKVQLGLTDNPSHMAFNGRCSLLFAMILK